MTEARPVGAPVENWTPAQTPEELVLEGRYAMLEPLRAEDHAETLYKQMRGHDWRWDYMGYGPFADFSAFRTWMAAQEGQPDPYFLAIKDRETDTWVGFCSLLRVDPAAGSIEVGHITMSPRLQRTRAATDAMYLLMKWAFTSGYRRYEWKCNALNAPSRRAAQRLGFSYEGIFRQAGVVKGRNRDTAWLAAIDSEWPALRAAFETWLDPANFDASGQQIERLSALTRPVIVATDPSLAAD